MNSRFRTTESCNIVSETNKLKPRPERKRSRPGHDFVYVNVGLEQADGGFDVTQVADGFPELALQVFDLAVLSPGEAVKRLEKRKRSRRGNAVAVSAPRSWRDPAGESPAQVSRSGRLVVSVAGRKATTVAKRTQQSLRG
ncbi:MAG TPA: hypothetical protein VHX61_09875, partial [Rhizomicrobium sp.]|nr:hypothetical protein [Rhizomicrobium sp.]